MSDFKLGDRVTMTGTVKKRRNYEDPTSANFLTKFVEDKLPHLYNKDGGTTYTEGVVVGRRFVQEGRTDYSGYDGDKCFRSSGVTHRVWIISFDLRYKPVMCFDHQITKETPNA
ncbi:hypothetical protein AFL94_08875 [Arthrobacter sp. LS16]|nr:hypothetical protein AFL94_08875 [Arthrobacter sp. LS16]